MNEFTLSELGLFVGTIGGVLVTLIFAIQKSKCDTIDCCGIKCHRKIPDGPDDDEPNPRPRPPLPPAEIEPPANP